jgi:LL-diaminopimelate aminotransferase
LSDQGLLEVKAQVQFYLENTKKIKHTLSSLGFETYGGVHAPYVWVRMQNMTSWQAFDYLLQTTHIVSTPGSGFGKSGEGFLRLSGFGSRKSVDEACQRMQRNLVGIHLMSQDLGIWA